MIAPRLGIGKKSHLPVFKILEFSFGPISIIHVLRSTRSFSLQDLGPEVIINTGTYTLKLNRRKAGMMVSEWGLWNKYYVPPGGLTGKTVLEVGAGCGESTALLFERGAAKVVCVEPASDEVALLRENIQRNGWNAEVIATTFEPSLLSDSFDLVRMDCEGCEAELLGQVRLPKLITEVHSAEVKQEFLKRGMRVLKQLGPKTCIMSNT